MKKLGITDLHMCINNSLDGGDCLHGGHYADDLADNYAANQSKVVSDFPCQPGFNNRLDHGDYLI